MRKFFSIKNPVLLLFIASTLLSLFWFRNGNIMGAGESGLPFYDLQRVFDLTKDGWAEFCLGNVVGIASATAPTFWFLLQLQNLKIPNFLIQALFINFSFFCSAVGVYLLVNELFPNLGKKSKLLAVFFYLFNPISLVNVWDRFLYNYMFFSALLPIALFLFLRGIKAKDYRFAILTSISTLIFSYSLTSTVFNFLLWFVLIFTLLFYIFIDHHKLLFYIKYFLLTLLFFLLFNAWWLGQLLSFIFSSGYLVATKEFFTQAGNVGTFLTLSELLGKLGNVFRFLHVTFFSKGPAWARIYLFPPIVFLEFLITGVIFWTIFRYTKTKYILFLGTLFLLTAFLIKGSEPPLGYVFQLAFEKFTPLQVFRNPFEKFGFIFSLAASLIFVYGLEKMVSSFGKKLYKGVIFFTASFLILVIWGFPFWTGLVFTSSEGTSDDKLADYEVKVPSYYQDANSWLLQENSDIRFISLPIGGEAINYTWERPYRGVELSTTLFKTPNISLNTSIPYYTDIVSELDWLFFHNQNFDEVLNILNAKYILNRFDIDWKRRGMRDPAFIENLLISRGSYEKTASFGKLDFWKSNSTHLYGKLYATQKFVESIPYPTISDLAFYEPNSKVTLYSGVDSKMEEIIAHPSRRFYLAYSPPTFFEERQDLFPHVRFLPSLPFYPLVLTKEKIENLLINNKVELSERIIILLGKRLNEFRQSVQKNDLKAAIMALDQYVRQLKEFEAFQKELGLLNTGSNYYNTWTQEKNYSIFVRHNGVLSENYNFYQGEDLRKKINETKNVLGETLTSLGIAPKFDYINNESMTVTNRVTSQINLPRDGEYELVIDMNNWEQFYEIEDSSIQFQIDNDIVIRKGVWQGNGKTSFGKLYFNQGIHEIGFNTPKQKNLIDAPSEFSVASSQGFQTKVFKLQNFDPYSSYQISFEYLIKRGSGLELFFETDNDRVIDGEVNYSFRKLLGPDEDNYDFDYKKYVLTFTPSSGATKAKIGIRASPWNDCFSIYRGIFSKLCNNESFRHKYDRTTEVVVKNLSVQRMVTDRLSLKYSNQDGEVDNTLPLVVYNKVNPTLYKVWVTGAQSNFGLIFSELFNSGWKVVLPNGEFLSEDRHFLANAFANGWEIDIRGDYELEVKYLPQDLLQVGSGISVASVVGGIIILGIQTIRRKDEDN